MYLVGEAHPNKEKSAQCLAKLVGERQRLVTDAEVFQEIMHRYAAIGRRDAIRPAFDVLLGVVDEVFDVQLADVLRAREIAEKAESLSARYALHAAVMERTSVTLILTFDRGFDQLGHLNRVLQA